MENIVWHGTIAALFTSLFAGIGGFLIFCKRRYSRENIDFMLNIAAGIMLASSVFTLLAPAVSSITQMESNLYLAGVWIVMAIVGGVGIIWLLHTVIPHEHDLTGKHKDMAVNARSSLLFVFAIAIHKLPEGLAVGVAYAGQELFDPKALAVGIALQNIPEGLMVAVSLVGIGYSRLKGALLATLSGLMQPLGALIAILGTGFSAKLVPFGMALAGGTMLFVIINEVLPETYIRRNEEKSSAAILIGFIFMTYLSIVLG